MRRWQVLQVLVVTEPPWSTTGRQQRLALLSGRLGSAMRIEVVDVEEIPMRAAGKFQAILPLPEDGAPP